MSRAGSERSSRSPLITAPIDTAVSSVLTVETRGEGFIDFSAEVRKFVADSSIKSGSVTLFVRHTSASLTIQENADPDVLTDLVTALHRLAPRDGGWIHDAEGPDDMPAHIRTMLTSTSLQIPVIDGRPALGTWQGVYLIEHRARPHRREIVMQAIGSRG
jgi:secondary thiamine-phosphate synthase enzyme